MEYGHPQRLML
ncbi:hypothetical protein YPPY05_2509, partial [Yersinia pestis PY-05]